MTGGDGGSTDHNPSFVTKVPWYIGSESGGSLDHQKNWKAPPSSSLNKSDQVTSSRVCNPDLECENCGQTGHARKDCLERPRKFLAKFSEIREVERGDEMVTHVSEQATGFETKRDRWEGYDAGEYDKVVAEWRKKEIDEMREKIRQQSGSATSGTTGITNASLAKSKFEADETVANLRIREDRAKYLYNLDVNSAYYDPKSRSMRDDPGGAAATQYRGDNYIRYTGDVQESIRARQFAWESASRGDANVHEIANPTESMMKMKKREKIDLEKVSESKRKILEKYGAVDEDSE
jgi:pre-mRNA-processing factor SLU7